MTNVQASPTKLKNAAAPRLSLDSLIPRDTSIVRLLVITLVLFTLFSLLKPATFPTPINLQSMAFQMSEIGILAIAVALTMISGGIDLSINATANLTAVAVASVITALAPAANTDAGTAATAVALAILAGLGVGLVCGLVNGLLVAYANIPPILATLGTMTLFTGIGTVITEGAAIFAQERLAEVGNGDIFAVPVPLIIFLMIAVGVHFLLSKSRFGFELYMVGTNPQASRFSGINNRNVLLRAYVISGILSALAGIVILGRTNAARVDFGESYVLLAIMICVLGGIDPAGGFGRIIGVVLAVVALQLLSTGLNQVFFDNPGANFFRQFAWGVTLLLVLLLNYFSARARQRRSTT
jgi:simple sugar transport system permease protein